MPLRTRNFLLCGVVETTSGMWASPTGANALLGESLTGPTPNVQLIETNEGTGSLDPQAPIVPGMYAEWSVDVYLKGSGAAGTPPDCGPFLKAAGYTEVITAAPIAAAAASAGTAKTLTLGTGFAATAQLYRGMPLTLATNPAAGATTFIWDYTVGKVASLTDTFNPVLDNTTTAALPANVAYYPGSGAIPTMSHGIYRDGIYYQMVGVAAAVSMEWNAGKPAKLKFKFTGFCIAKTDAAVPANPTLNTTRPPVWRAGAHTLNSVAAAVTQLTLDLGNNVVVPPNPNGLEGFDPAIITGRKQRGQIDPQEVLTATRNLYQAFRNQTLWPLHARMGATPGNRVALTVPQAQFLNETPTDQSGVVAVTVPFAPNGLDSASHILCFY
ncbi:hypothetical protein [Nitrospirillum sp. BR 11163]|uniref:hypothetical protein n=1 Tax=Nitrospirillum sp. BR 11163 TaxID=3104323 RepID=UPI002AFDD856|nr:hypothetical protein [Nitrospirillum sp. BR 11163]MEA1674099.1 hypothetical protein [Nitrospirillum sp. BR 11163]